MWSVIPNPGMPLGSNGIADPQLTRYLILICSDNHTLLPDVLLACMVICTSVTILFLLTRTLVHLPPSGVLGAVAAYLCRPVLFLVYHILSNRRALGYSQEG